MFGERLRALRLSKNLSQIHLADMCGTSRKNIENWETGKKEPKIAELSCLANALGVTFSELVGIEAELS